MVKVTKAQQDCGITCNRSTLRLAHCHTKYLKVFIEFMKISHCGWLIYRLYGFLPEKFNRIQDILYESYRALALVPIPPDEERERFITTTRFYLNSKKANSQNL